MKLKIKVEKFIKVEIPSYRRFKDQYYYYVYSEKYCIQVQKLSTAAISDTFIALAFLHEGTTDCSKEEFDNAFNETLNVIKEKLWD